MKLGMLDNLYAFLVLEDCGTLKEAAQKLSCNSTTLSRKIQQLENETGLKLFDRLPTGYTLTPHGERMRTQLEPLHTAYAGFEQWLVIHEERRNLPELRLIADRISSLITSNRPLYRGVRPHEEAIA